MTGLVVTSQEDEWYNHSGRIECTVVKELTSAIFCKAGAAMNTTYGENSAVRRTFRA